MEFDILNFRDKSVQFTAEINCTEAALRSEKLGLAVQWAKLYGVNLRGADLGGADLNGANLSGVNLHGADLGDADLRFAYLGDTDLSGVNLSSANLGRANLGGVNLRGADLSGADLHGAYLGGVDLRDTCLRGVNLSDANLHGVNLQGANLGGANLCGADLNGASLRGAYLGGADLGRIPVIPNIDSAILKSIKANKAAGMNGLKMETWHGEECDENNWCQTTHCRAGYAICIAGAAGFALEQRVGPSVAGALIYAKSRPDKPVPDFYCDDDEAMADIRRGAAEEAAKAADDRSRQDP